MPAHDLIGKHRAHLLSRITSWSGLREQDVGTILTKLEERSEALGLEFSLSAMGNKLIDIASIATSLAMDFAYTGRFMG